MYINMCSRVWRGAWGWNQQYMCVCIYRYVYSNIYYIYVYTYMYINMCSHMRRGGWRWNEQHVIIEFFQHYIFGATVFLFSWQISYHSLNVPRFTALIMSRWRGVTHNKWVLNIYTYTQYLAVSGFSFFLLEKMYTIQ